jgi:SAM-dependent methyltransferase
VRRVLRWGLAAVNRRLQHRPAVRTDTTAELGAIKEFLLSLEQPDASAAEYVRTHLERLALTVGLTPNSRTSGRCLELGSYMHIAPALQQLRGYGHVHTAGLGPKGGTVRKVAVSKGREVLRSDMDLFDAERDAFPYPDNWFETVLACEIIEHLRADPMHMLFEAFRVLEADGLLLITTPNCASTASLEQILWRSSNPYTYSLYPHPEKTAGDASASHIREYTPDEIAKAVECAGFRVERLLTQPGRAVETADLIQDILVRYGFPTDLRGEQIYCLARKDGSVARTRFPEFLYG